MMRARCQFLCAERGTTAPSPPAKWRKNPFLPLWFVWRMTGVGALGGECVRTWNEGVTFAALIQLAVFVSGA